MIFKAFKDMFRRYRLLERASVDYKTGDIVVRGLGQERPPSLAKKLLLEDFAVADGKVKSGKITVYPPDHDEAQIVAYVLYWAKEVGGEMILRSYISLLLHMYIYIYEITHLSHTYITKGSSELPEFLQL